LGNQTQANQNKQPTKTPARPEISQSAGLESAGPGLIPGMTAAFGDGSNDAQLNRLQDRRFQTAQRQELARRIGSVQGNNHLQRLADPVQRAPAGTLVKIPYNYTKTIPINKGKYIKLSEIALTVGGSIEEIAPAGGGSSTTVEVGGTSTKEASKDAFTIKAESKKAADDFFSQKASSLSDSIKPYSKKAAGFSRSDDEAKVNVAYEHGLDIDPFIAQNIQLTTAIEFNLLELKKEPGKAPEFKVLAAVPKAELSGKAENFPVQGMQANLKGEIAATFEPDWVTLGLLVLETPVGWVLATAAGGLAIVYFTMKDVERRQQLMFKVRAGARSAVKSANVYAMVISGKEVSPSGSFEQKAVDQAKSDLAGIASGKKMSVDTYYALVEADHLESNYYIQAYNRYKARALGDFESKVIDEIRAWHDEHWIQSFFAMRYASDDIAAARAAIDIADRSEGEGFH
jgi:hypothetical protein